MYVPPNIFGLFQVKKMLFFFGLSASSVVMSRFNLVTFAH